MILKSMFSDQKAIKEYFQTTVTENKVGKIEKDEKIVFILLLWSQ